MFPFPDAQVVIFNHFISKLHVIKKREEYEEEASLSCSTASGRPAAEEQCGMEHAYSSATTGLERVKMMPHVPETFKFKSCV